MRFALFLVLFSVSFQVSATDFVWTKRHPFIYEYVENNEAHIRKYSNILFERYKLYAPEIEKAAKRYGVPKEIAVLPAIESGYRAKVGNSISAAAGMWQFMPSTSRDWGLRVDRRVDERLDWEKSTDAAIRYIKWLAEENFDHDYEMAILAYSAGVGKVKRAMAKYDITDPWELATKEEFHEEQKFYLPKFIAFLDQFRYLEMNSK